MRYCLSEKEYEDLLSEPLENRKKLQRVCMLAANFVPVPPEGTPWECYLDANGKPTKKMKGHFCDGCPVRKECPYLNKKFERPRDSVMPRREKKD